MSSLKTGGEPSLPGVSPARRKDGTPYFRAGLTYRGRHVSLGSFPGEAEAHAAYQEGRKILDDPELSLSTYPFSGVLTPEKVVSLFNFRDNGLYSKTPIYLRANYLEYWFSPDLIYKFDIDDLFYYSMHKIQRRGGHLFVSEYGMQTTILSRYGVRAHGALGKDYSFANGDPTDLRYSNVIVVNALYGVDRVGDGVIGKYRARIHVKGYYLIGVYATEAEAAVAYNKAADLAGEAGVRRSFRRNYIEGWSKEEYARVYAGVEVSGKYREYLRGLSGREDPC